MANGAWDVNLFNPVQPSGFVPSPRRISSLSGAVLAASSRDAPLAIHQDVQASVGISGIPALSRTIAGVLIGVLRASRHVHPAAADGVRTRAPTAPEPEPLHSSRRRSPARHERSREGRVK